jgi:hypothetical protein
MLSSHWLRDGISQEVLVYFRMENSEAHFKIDTFPAHELQFCENMTFYELHVQHKYIQGL